MPGSRVLIAAFAAVLLLVACSSGGTPEAGTPSPVPSATEPPTPTAAPRAVESTTSVTVSGISVGRATTGAELRVDQGHEVCSARLSVHGSSLPGDTALQLRWTGDDEPLAQFKTGADGTFHRRLGNVFPEGCGPGSTYELSATSGQGEVLVSVEIRAPEGLRSRIAVMPEAGGCGGGEIVIVASGLRPRRPIVIRSRPYAAEGVSTETTVVTLDADRFGAASSGPIASPWNCDGGPVELSASVGGDVPSAPWTTRPYIVDVNDWDPIPGLPVHAPEVRTGVAAVDRAIELVAARDAVALAGLAVASPLPCASGDYSPPCPDGASPGSGVDVFSFGACHGEFVLEDQMPAGVAPLFTRWLGVPDRTGTIPLPLRLHSIARVEATAVEDSAYLLIFAFPDGSMRQLPLRSDGRVPTLSLGCSGPLPLSVYSTTGVDWLLPPP